MEAKGSGSAEEDLGDAAAMAREEMEAMAEEAQEGEEMVAQEGKG